MRLDQDDVDVLVCGPDGDPAEPARGDIGSHLEPEGVPVEPQRDVATWARPGDPTSVQAGWRATRTEMAA